MKLVAAVMLAGLAAAACGGGSHGASASGPSNPAYCAAVAAYQQSVVADQGTPAVLKAPHSENMAARFARVDATAPASIKSDTAYVLKLENELVATIKANGNDVFRAEEQLGKTDPIDSTRQDTATKNIARATRSQCHVLFDVTASQHDVEKQLADPSGCHTENTDLCK